MRAVLFDLDETLVPEDAPLHRAYLAVARALDPTAGDAEVEELRTGVRAFWAAEAPEPEYRAATHVSASDGMIATFEGDGAERAAVRAFLPEFRARVFPDPALVEEWVRVRIAGQTAYPGAEALLRALRGRYKLGLVTNGTSDFQRRKAELSGLAGYFDAVVAAADVGEGKPEPLIFTTALDALGVDASEAVMVGNDHARDIVGAERVGIRALWVQHGGADGALGDLAQVLATLQ